MAETSILAAFASAYLGFALLALSQKRHATQVTGWPSKMTLPSATIAKRRCGGAIGITGCLILCEMTEGPSFGTLLGMFLYSASAGAVALTLTWRPIWLRWLAFESRTTDPLSERTTP